MVFLSGLVMGKCNLPLLWKKENHNGMFTIAKSEQKEMIMGFKQI
jgi:hypothetical protein